MKDRALIHHFKLVFTEGYSVPAGEVYAAEREAIRHGPLSDGANKPFRVKLRAPGFAHLSSMDAIMRPHARRRRRQIAPTMSCSGDRS